MIDSILSFFTGVAFVVSSLLFPVIGQQVDPILGGFNPVQVQALRLSGSGIASTDTTLMKRRKNLARTLAKLRRK